MKRANEKLKLVMEAGETLFAEKGFHKATMRQIAKAAGVGVGTIYQYFPDKEALLLAIPEYKMRELLDGLGEHLQGIHGAFNKLRKFTWFMLRYYEANPSFVSFIYLIIKPHQAWHNSPSYRLVQQYSGILTEILKEGQAEGVVRDDVDVRLMRILHLGSLERLAISWLLQKKPASLVSGLDPLVELVISAISKPTEMTLPVECPFARQQRVAAGSQRVGKKVAHASDGEFWDSL